MLTEYDESLMLDTTRDVMGFEVIWSTLGTAIFQNMLTTVANDMRNFTLNFFNHAIVHELLTNHHILNQDLLKLFSQYDDPTFKIAVIILLENIFSLKCAEADQTKTSIDGYDPDAVLGRNAAAVVLSTYDQLNDVKLILHPHAGFLVRQHQLGVHGRYKSPFQEIGIFTNKRLGYNQDDFKEFLAVDDELERTVREIAKLLCGVLNLCTCSRKDPEHFKDLRNAQAPFLYIPYSKVQDIGDKMFSLFKGHDTVMKYHVYWLDKLGITEGTIAHKLFSYVRDQKDDVPIFDVFAQESVGASEQIQHIRHIEPWLSLCLYIFNKITKGDGKPMADVVQEVDLEKLINSINERPESLKVENQNLFNTRYAAILKIIDLAIRKEYEKMIQEIVDYQTKIMKSRGNSPLVRIQDGVIKSLYPNSSKFYKGKEFDSKNYQHSYYINSVRQLAKGFQQ